MLASLAWLIIASVLAAVVLLLGLYLYVKKKKSASWGIGANGKVPFSIGFLHPHSLSGGGGERVLWCAVKAVREAVPDAEIVVYSAWSEADLSLSEALSEAQSTVLTQFGLDIEGISFLPIDVSCAHLVDPTRYPRFTLLLQALGAVRLGLHAYCRLPVDLFIDTANLTFGLVFPKLLGAQTLSYVHYPTISTDMLTVVRTRRAQFNNSSSITNSDGLSFLKLIYYRMFAFLYALAALSCDMPLANSSWTRNHLESLWWRNQRLKTVFPPCPTLSASPSAEDTERDDKLIVSVGQFRPEKNHKLQLDIIEHLQRHYPMLGAKLIMIGGTRNELDEKRAHEIEESAKKRMLPVTVVRNASREQLAQTLRTASVGLHTMRDEHFGISVVELQAHGLLTVAHNSGGVRIDIVRQGETGLLAGDGGAVEYADRIVLAMEGMGEDDRRRMREKALKAAGRFSEDAFQEEFAAVVARLVPRKE